MTWAQFKAKVEAAGVKDGDVLHERGEFRPFSFRHDDDLNDDPLRVTGGYTVIGLELDAVVTLGLSD